MVGSPLLIGVIYRRRGKATIQSGERANQKIWAFMGQEPTA
jgi:hypothetical protein